MKKLMIMTMICALLLGVFSLSASALDEAPTTVFVTIVTVEENSAKLVLAQKQVTVTDIDGDETLTVNDALYAAHDANYTGGAAAGYASSQTQYGLSLDKLWGVANGGSYGYCVNNVSAMSLADPIQSGDYITAYVYAYGVCDTYAYFDVNTVTGDQWTKVELTLGAVTYDPVTWEPVVEPVAYADLVIDGAVSDYKTNILGKVTLTLEDAGIHVVSARKTGMGLVSPVCVTNVAAAAAPDTDIDLPELPLPDSGTVTTAPTATEKSGCGSVASGAGLLLTALAAGVVIGRRKQDEV